MTNPTPTRGRGPTKGQGGRPKNLSPNLQYGISWPAHIVPWLKTNKALVIKKVLELFEASQGK